MGVVDKMLSVDSDAVGVVVHSYHNLEVLRVVMSVAVIEVVDEMLLLVSPVVMVARVQNHFSYLEV